MTTDAMQDQYASGTAVKVWDLYVGDAKERTKVYKNWLVNLLRKHECYHVLDVAVGTG